MTTDQSPWLTAQEQLAHFTLHRCVMMKHEDWRELSSVMSAITNLYTSSGSGSSGPPAFVYTLELLLKLGQVTSCLLSLNGDDPAFSVARVAQAIKTTTCVLDSCHSLSEGAGLPSNVADSLARQRCEQTPLLQAMAWALRQEARALFFNPRPTALSLATALLELFRAIERIWPDDIFVPPHAHEAAAAAAAARSGGGPPAARLADPAAQLAMALMRCAGRAMGEVGAASSKQIMLGGLRVADDLMHQISSLMVRAETLGDQLHVKELLQSPSILQLMLTLLAIQTQRLQQQLGITCEDSFTFKHPVQHDIAVPEVSDSSDDESLDSTDSSRFDAAQDVEPTPICSRVRSDSDKQQGNKRQREDQQQLQRQQSKRQQGQQPQQCESSDEDDHVHDGAGELHQLWNQVLGMAKRQAAVLQPPQPEQPSTPLVQFWKAVGLPEAMLALAATSDVFTRPPDVEYVQACKVARFLLQGSAHLQPSKEQGNPAASSAATAALDLAGLSAEGVQHRQTKLSRDLSPLSPRSPQSPSLPNPTQGVGGHRDREGAMSPAAATAALLVDSCRDYGLRGQEELEVLSLQRLLPVVLLDTAAALTSGQFDCPFAAAHAAAAVAAQSGAPYAATAAVAPPGKRMNGSRSHSSLARLSCGSCSMPTQLEIVSAACAAAAYSARCWPVLQKVAAAQSEPPVFSLAGAPSGVFAGLSMVYWQQYELEQPEMHLPVQELLQLVVQVIQQLFGQPLAQQQQKQLQQLLSLSACIATQNPAAAETNGAVGNEQQPELRSPTKLLDGTANMATKLQPEADIAAAITLQPSDLGNVKQPVASAPSAPATADDDTQALLGTAIIPSRPPLSPRSREALWGLLEVLTAVSKLPWEVEPQASTPLEQHKHHKHRRHHSSDGHGLGTAGVKAQPAGRGQDGAGRSFRQQQLDRSYTAEAWKATSQAVAAAVEAVLRSCSGTSAVVRAAPKGCATSSHGGLLGALSGGRERHRLLHPATVALGSCLASMCAPIGRPGPLVSAVGLTAPCSGAQLQLFALLASKIKLMLTDTSGRKELIAMHPIEQTPVHILDQLSLRLRSAAASKQDGSDGNSGSSRSCGSAKRATTAGGVAVEVAAAAVPWLLILARLIKLRGRLLGELLQRDREAAATGLGNSENSATATLHNAFWHIQMATASALAVEKHVVLLAGVSSNNVGRMLAERAQQAGLLPAVQAVQVVPCKPEQQAVQLATQQATEQPDHVVTAPHHADQQQEVLAAAATAVACPVGGFDLQQVLQQLQSEVLPALKQAVQLCKAAMKLARHYHETGFASGFAAGFAAGYAAALAAGAGSAAAAGGRSISFVSPAGVLQQASIRDLPQLLKTFGGVLSGQLVLPLWCNNPHCLNMNEASELQLLTHGTGKGHSGVGLHGVACLKCGAARYCSEGCRAQHKTRHKPLCKQLCERLECQGVH